jgi:hypothetical protein
MSENEVPPADITIPEGTEILGPESGYVIPIDEIPPESVEPEGVPEEEFLNVHDERPDILLTPAAMCPGQVFFEGG